jgi:hypothetical protein
MPDDLTRAELWLPCGFLTKAEPLRLGIDDEWLCRRGPLGLPMSRRWLSSVRMLPCSHGFEMPPVDSESFFSLYVCLLGVADAYSFWSLETTSQRRRGPRGIRLLDFATQSPLIAGVSAKHRPVALAVTWHDYDPHHFLHIHAPSSPSP